MGGVVSGFVSMVTSFVEWIGDVICGVVNWFRQLLHKVSGIVRAFVLGKEEIIKRADNPKNFGECLAIRKERGELDNHAREREKKLSQHDRDLLDDCFKDY